MPKQLYGYFPSSMLMVAHVIARGQCAIQVGQNKLFRVVSYSPDNNLDPVLTEQVLSPDAHTTGYDNICSFFRQPRRENTWLVIWGNNQFFVHDLPSSFIHIDQGELFTVAKMRGYLAVANG
jgi:hypothetical protein